MIDQLPERPSWQRPTLSAWDAASIVFGIVVGTSLFKAPPAIFAFAGDTWTGMGLWVLGGFLSLCGAFCYCELVTTYPLLGTEFVFLARAYGRPVGFLFAWTQLCAVMTGNVGAMAFVFADYGGSLFPVLAKFPAMTAAFVIGLLAVVNLLGLSAGRRTQNALSMIKLTGLAVILIAGLISSSAPLEATRSVAIEQGSTQLGLALVFVLYSYGGWNDASQVATEVTDLERNVPRVLIAGLGSVIVLYVLINFAYVHGLGYAAVCASQAPAVDVVKNAWGTGPARLVSLLVMISALGAINGMLLSGVRLAAAMGRDHRLLGPLNHWNLRGVPPYALIFITAVSLVQVLTVGTRTGQKWIDLFSRQLGFGPFPWSKFGGGFETLVSISSPTFWLFFLLTSLAVMVLRWRDPHRPRPYRVPFYPLTPLLFTGMCGYMLYSSVSYAQHLSLFGAVVALTGLSVYVLDMRRRPE